MRVTKHLDSVAATAETIFQKLNDFQQVGRMYSDKLQNWQITEDGCSFSVNNMATCTLHILEQVPFSKIVYRLDTDKNMSAIATINIIDKGQCCDIDMELNANVPFFMEPMLKGMLGQQVDTLLAQIKNSIERN